jgi:HSP20 family protein
MAETATKMPVRNEGKGTDRPAEWRPFESLRREVDRLFEDFQLGSWRSPFGRSVFDVQPFWRGEIGWGKAPAVDIVDKGNAYEITAELPGMDESNIDVKFADGTLTIKGEKRDEKEEKKKQGQRSEKKIAIKKA